MKIKTNNTNISTKMIKSSTKVIFRYRKVLLIVAFFSLISLEGIAQPPPPGGSGPSCWPPPCIPIDGGISFLIAAGVAYGAKKSWDFGKKNKEEDEDIV